ncbi:MAG: hypothetical protein ACI9LY_003546 [Arenicella sp.]|jgi:hypothetical protein
MGRLFNRASGSALKQDFIITGTFDAQQLLALAFD